MSEEQAEYNNKEEQKLEPQQPVVVQKRKRGIDPLRDKKKPKPKKLHKAVSRSLKKGRMSIYEQQRRKKATMLFVRHVCALRSMDYRKLMEGIIIDIPDNMMQWEKIIVALEQTLPFDFKKPLNINTDNDKQEQPKQALEPIATNKNVHFTDKDGKEVMITNCRVLRKILGSWRDTGDMKNHPLSPFKPIE